MLPSTSCLIACLIAVAAITAVDSSEKEKKPGHRLLTHHTTHHKHKSATESSDVKHDAPPLKGLGQDSIQHKKQPPPMVSSTIDVGTLSLETSNHQPETLTSATSPITESDNPPQVDVAPPITIKKTDLILTSKETELKSTELETATHQSSIPTTDSLITQLGIPRQEDLTKPFTHYGTETSELSKKIDFDSLSLESDENMSTHQKDTTTHAPLITAMGNPPQKHRTHHLTNHKKHVPVNSTHDKLVGSLHPESVNHQTKKLTVVPIPEPEHLQDTEVVDHVTNLNQEQTTSSPTSESEIPTRKANTHDSADATADTQPSHGMNETQFNELAELTSNVETSSSPKTDSKDLSLEKSFDNMTDTDMKMSVADTKSYVVKVKSPKSGGNRMRSRPEQDTDERRIMNHERDDNIADESRRYIHNRHQMSKVRQRGNMEQPLLDEITSNAESEDIEDLREDANNRNHDISRSGHRQVTGSKPLKEEEEEVVNEQQVAADETDPNHENVRMVTSGKKDHTRRTQTPSVPRRNSGTRHFKATINEQQSNDDETKQNNEDTDMETLERRGHKQRTHSYIGPRITDGKNLLHRRVENQNIMDDETREMRGNTKTSLLDEGESNSRDRTFTESSEYAGNKKHKGRVSEQTFVEDEQQENKNEDFLEERDNKIKDRTFTGTSENASSKKHKIRVSEQTFVDDETKENTGMAALEDRENNRDNIYTEPNENTNNKKHKGRVSEQIFVDDEIRTTQEHVNMASSDERRSNRKDHTSLGHRRVSGHKQVKTHVTENEFNTEQNQEDTEEDVDTSEERRGNRRIPHRVSGQKRPSGNKRVEEQATGQQRSTTNKERNTETDPLEEHSKKINSRPSVSPRRSSGSNQAKTRVASLEFKPDEPEIRHTKTEENTSKRRNHPSAPLRHTSRKNQENAELEENDPLENIGNSRTSSRRVNLKKQSHHRSDISVEDEEGDEEEEQDT